MLPIQFQLVSWNVNSLRVRMPLLQELLQVHQPDVVCLQETKVVDELFPLAQIEEMGFDAIFSGQKTYNGVSILYRRDRVKLLDKTLDGLVVDDAQKRFISARLLTSAGELQVACVYVPNGQDIDTPAYEYKLNWLTQLKHWCEQHVRSASAATLVVCGDFNIAPTDDDVHSPDSWREQILCSTPERQVLQSLLSVGLVDVYRHKNSAALAQLNPKVQDRSGFTWWDYRQFAFPKNKGLRIDFVLAQPKLLDSFDASVWVDVDTRRKEKPSDHAPVFLKLHSASGV